MVRGHPRMTSIRALVLLLAIGCWTDAVGSVELDIRGVPAGALTRTPKDAEGAAFLAETSNAATGARARDCQEFLFDTLEKKVRQVLLNQFCFVVWRCAGPKASQHVHCRSIPGATP